MLSSFIIPQKIQNVFLGKSIEKKFYSKSIDLFKEDLIKSNPRINATWNNSLLEIDVCGFTSLNAFKTTFNAVCLHESGGGLTIRGKFKYDFIAKSIMIISLSFFLAISFSNKEFLLGCLILYFFIQIEGLMLLIIDSIFNSSREKIIMNSLQKICSSL